MFFENITELHSILPKKKDSLLTGKEAYKRKAAMDITLLALCLRADTFDFCALA
jgi:hypothetical protein